ncbi:MAG: hypothetical protein ABIH59_00960 [archaeon]
MNKKQKEVIAELKNLSKKLGHSPTRREDLFLAKKCYGLFNSFNKAKEVAGLEIKNKRVTSFPKEAFELDKNLVIIIAFLTADGHLCKDLKGFYFSSRDIKFLEYLARIVDIKFGLKGRYSKGQAYGKSYKYRVFNKKITLFLKTKGAPAGDKMLIPFDVPEWIKTNKEFSKEYLKILFYCEGSKYKHSKNTEAIKINFNKAERLLKDCINFMNSLKDMLRIFEIETTNIWIMKGNLRKKDWETTKTIVFKLKSNSVNRFIKEIGWLK